MNIGMLWLDADSHRTFEEKVKRAADYYSNKYGRKPELCLVNSRMGEVEKQVGTIQVQTAKNVLPHHFWLGMKVS